MKSTFQPRVWIVDAQRRSAAVGRRDKRCQDVVELGLQLGDSFVSHLLYLSSGIRLPKSGYGRIQPPSTTSVWPVT